MSTPAKLLLLFATLVPIVYMAVFVGIAFSFITGSPVSGDFPQQFVYLFIAHIGMILWLTALFGCYCLLLYRSTLEPVLKVVWIAVILFTGPFGMLVYWYLQVWRRNRGFQATPR